MGGAADILTSFEHARAKAPVIRALLSTASWNGKTVLRMHTRQLGMAVVELGGGRTFFGPIH